MEGDASAEKSELRESARERRTGFRFHVTLQSEAGRPVGLDRLRHNDLVRKVFHCKAAASLTHPFQVVGMSKYVFKSSSKIIGTSWLNKEPIFGMSYDFAAAGCSRSDDRFAAGQGLQQSSGQPFTV